ncbi:B12-binding domain-containing radical SAM protein [Quisquiliibacterium transsilvanicum]|uniref:Radical SAM superfamily enzyme YgiQ (UPF0313 family) n=1 Tax=Quisquiliibacterium transsilvanicum TaxID=1549638 RepID=A0A7W8HJK1_9BURK|nr:B12-binding domain-containing radical SAM protein [Quisquiliibacterium transsilvanicum]MBB5272408.1 radical SAM superfamily enzyme YgiQ (UPF0313 family) [Quisquiliibacterium transsilvanicum]
MSDILLVTINARYQHASLGLRCLHANLGGLAQRASILEFVSGARTEDMLERVLERGPRIVGIGVYIWNVVESTRLVAQLRAVAPGVTVILGGPEVSHEHEGQRICALADHVVTGPGEHAFRQLCEEVLAGQPPAARVISGGAPAPASLALPYPLYGDEDLRHRFLYVEASRGCPFRCEFCLSALDRTAEPFPLDAILDALRDLHARGARRFKFVDRTFNLKVSTSLAILEFFLERLEERPDDPVFAHFELVPDHLPERLREAIRRFPPGTLQLEIGIQTWNPAVQALISRRQDDAKAAANLEWLACNTHAHTHVDLIAGLPGEDLDSFGAGFDRLVALAPHEIQVGILKRLRGAPIARHTEAFGLVFSPEPPYNVLATDRIAFADMQRIARFARYWDLVGNSGRFPRTLPLLLGDAPFRRFMALADWLYARTDATSRLSAERQFELVREWLLDQAGTGAVVDEALLADYAGSGARGRPSFLARAAAGAGRNAAATGTGTGTAAAAPGATAATPKRQARHLA